MTGTMQRSTYVENMRARCSLITKPTDARSARGATVRKSIMLKGPVRKDLKLGQTASLVPKSYGHPPRPLQNDQLGCAGLSPQVHQEMGSRLDFGVQGLVAFLFVSLFVTLLRSCPPSFSEQKPNINNSIRLMPF